VHRQAERSRVTVRGEFYWPRRPRLALGFVIRSRDLLAICRGPDVGGGWEDGIG